MKPSDRVVEHIRKCGNRKDEEVALSAQAQLCDGIQPGMIADALDDLFAYDPDSLPMGFETEEVTSSLAMRLSHLEDARWDIVARFVETLTENVKAKVKGADGYAGFMLVPQKEAYHRNPAEMELKAHIILVKNLHPYG